MAGPCAIEGEDIALRIAEKIIILTEKLEIPFIFKGSYRKANRSKGSSFTGIGDEKALKILEKIAAIGLAKGDGIEKTSAHYALEVFRKNAIQPAYQRDSRFAAKCRSIGAHSPRKKCK